MGRRWWRGAALSACPSTARRLPFRPLSTCTAPSAPRSCYSKRLGEDAIAIYRRKHGLLSADEIRAIRDQFNLTQADLARLLRLGANTVSRWESGRNVQTAAMDILLRMIRDLPGSIEYLRDHAG